MMFTQHCPGTQIFKHTALNLAGQPQSVSFSVPETHCFDDRFINGQRELATRTPTIAWDLDRTIASDEWLFDPVKQGIDESRVPFALRPNIQHTLTRLTQAGLRQILVTQSATNRVAKLFAQYPWLPPFFDTIICREHLLFQGALTCAAEAYQRFDPTQTPDTLDLTAKLADLRRGLLKPIDLLGAKILVDDMPLGGNNQTGRIRQIFWPLGALTFVNVPAFEAGFYFDYTTRELLSQTEQLVIKQRLAQEEPDTTILPLEPIDPEMILGAISR